MCKRILLYLTLKLTKTNSFQYMYKCVCKYVVWLYKPVYMKRLNSAFVYVQIGRHYWAFSCKLAYKATTYLHTHFYVYIEMNLFLLTLKLNNEGYVCTWHSLRRLFKFVGIFKAFLKDLKLTFKDIWLNLYTFFLFF